MNFIEFKQAVAKQFNRMQKHSLFKVQIEGDLLWSTYLASFPPGTNPMYRERPEHDCSACRGFIKRAGGLVTIIDGKAETIWDVTNRVTTSGHNALDEGYRVVAAAMAALVKSKPIDNLFLSTEKVAGVDKHFEQLVDEVKTWEHFFINIPKECVVKNTEIGPKLSDIRATHDVMLRSLKELTTEAVETVLELIAQNSLYRGAEQKFALESFTKLQVEFNKLATDAEKDLYVWSKVGSTVASVARIRNTAIGTLLVNLSEGFDLEDAVKAFEAVVAPANYKRPTALVTKAQVEKAKQTIMELGLISALERRYATIDDITVNNVLFADRSTRKLDVDVFDQIASSTKSKPKSLSKVEEVTIDKFLSDVLPKATSVEIMFENKHIINLVSLIAPADPTAGRLFKWSNNFCWSYNGDLADSEIRRAVQARGGRVDGVFRFSHSWNHEKRNASLMDLHVFMPGSTIKAGNPVNNTYGNDQRVGWNHRKHSKSGGVQDVDYTAAAPEGYIPVENTTFPSLSRMPDGLYVCKIHNWQFRNPTQGGFRAEIEFGGQVFQYDYDKPLKDKEWVTVAEVQLEKGAFAITHHLPHGEIQKNTWGVNTQNFQRVKAIMLSPNHWDGHSVGNKHYFFMIDGCVNDGKARGFYNEFLKEELNAHRKVIEIVGAKMKTDESQHQLSGLGFSSTQRNTLLCRVRGSFTRTLKVIF